MSKLAHSAVILFVCGLAWAPAAPAQDPPAVVGRHSSSPQDRQAIQQLLDGYTTALTAGDEAAFTALLLNTEVPFTSAAEAAAVADPQQAQTRHFDEFRRIVFRSGKHFRQRFYNVRIEQDGPLAQVSLDFVTLGEGKGQSGYGWKVLQLLKVQGQWKIASEIYTAYPLPEQG